MYENIPTVTLNDGLVLPQIGFGTYTLKGSIGVNVINSAINVGYKLLDSAYNYENEGAVGEAIKRAGIKREELFITSKLPGRYQKRKLAIEAIKESLFRAKLDYLDLYLIHWPNPITNNYVEAWQTLIDAKNWGLIRSIGVSNFLPSHIDNIFAQTSVMPSINQIELHPSFSQKEQLKYNKEKGIITQSWSPLGRGNGIIDNSKIVKIAKKYDKTPSQVVLRWHVELGSMPIPKSSLTSRQKENIDIFDFTLTKEDISAINSLDKKDGRTANQDPAIYEEF
ncbi:MAG: aldo/keto reductase [Campylobacteraceae bacterium]